MLHKYGAIRILRDDFLSSTDMITEMLSQIKFIPIHGNINKNGDSLIIGYSETFDEISDVLFEDLEKIPVYKLFYIENLNITITINDKDYPRIKNYSSTEDYQEAIQSIIENKVHEICNDHSLNELATSSIIH